MDNKKEILDALGITDEDRRLAALADARPGGNLDTLNGLKNEAVRRVQMDRRVSCNPGSNAHRLCCAVAVLIEKNRKLIGTELTETLLDLPMNYLGDVEAKNAVNMQQYTDNLRGEIRQQIETEMASSTAELNIIKDQLNDARGAKEAIREEIQREFDSELFQLEYREKTLATERQQFQIEANKAIAEIKSKMKEFEKRKNHE